MSRGLDAVLYVGSGQVHTGSACRLPDRTNDTSWWCGNGDLSESTKQDDKSRCFCKHVDSIEVDFGQCVAVRENV